MIDMDGSTTETEDTVMVEKRGEVGGDPVRGK